MVFARFPRPGAHLDASWGSLGPSWGPLGPSWRLLGRYLGPCGTCLEAMWQNGEPS